MPAQQMKTSPNLSGDCGLKQMVKLRCSSNSYKNIYLYMVYVEIFVMLTAVQFVEALDREISA